MVVMSIKLNRRRIAAGAFALFMATAITVTGVRLLSGQDRMASVTPTGETSEPKQNSAGTKVKTSEDRAAFVRSFGWEIESDPVEVLEVVIPKEFDEVYLQYNSIQKQQGFDLEKHAGKRAKRYSYLVTNYPGTGAEVRFNLLVRDNKVIGGDVSSLEADGFLHGFQLQEAPRNESGASMGMPPSA